jgi:lambda family phage portal protein
MGLSYDAADTTMRRKAPLVNLDSEDRILTAGQRRKLTATARDLRRNFSTVSWAIRKHLDYVATFSFQSQTGNPELDAEIEEKIAWWSRAENCDVTGRYPLARQIRLAEECRTLDGDILCLRIAGDPQGPDYGKVQWIEGDRVGFGFHQLPPAAKQGKWTHGVHLDDKGRPIEYAVSRRAATGGLLEFERALPAAWCHLHGYFDRFDQVRGISPLAAAINVFRDAYEGADYALAKMKVSQYFGLVFFRKAEEAVAEITEAEETESGATTGPKADFKQGPVQLDLDPGDDAKFLESNSPSMQFQTFFQEMIAAGLKGLDIPYSFYAENFTNWAGQRQAVLQYESSTEPKRRDCQQMLDWLTAWRLGLFIADGQIRLPPASTFEDLRWEWIPVGLRWFDPLKEAASNRMAVQSGFESTPGVCKAAGRDAYDIVDEEAKYLAYRQEKGLPPLPVAAGNPSAPPPDARGDKE